MRAVTLSVPFSWAMLTSPSARRSFLSVEAQDELPLFLGARWNREAGGSAGQD